MSWFFFLKQNRLCLNPLVKNKKKCRGIWGGTLSTDLCQRQISDLSDYSRLFLAFEISMTTAKGQELLHQNKKHQWDASDTLGSTYLWKKLFY